MVFEVVEVDLVVDVEVVIVKVIDVWICWLLVFMFFLMW